MPWSVAGRVGGLMTGDVALSRSYHMEQLAEVLPGITAEASVLVAEETRLVTPGISQVLVVDRRQWIERNVKSFGAMLAPIEDRLQAQAGSDPSRRGVIGPQLVAAEVGAVLGFVSRRVLGQYELVVPGDDQADSVAFVGPNLLQMERSHQLVPSEFRMWVALHEAAHRAQFVGVPWMRPHFMGLVEALVGAAEPTEIGPTRLVAQLRESRRTGTSMVDEMGLVGMIATGDRHEHLMKIQALMCLLEGHGHAVMDRLGGGRLVSQPRMAGLLKQRRNDPRTAWFMKLTGLEMKMRQYELGEEFVLAVSQRAGWEALDVAWATPEALPSYDEIRNPAKWLLRVA